MADVINARSWFCVFNNPEKHGFEDKTPEQICESMCDIWMENNPQRACAVTYCISAEGLQHCHAVFEDIKTMRFTLVKKLFPSMHIQPTKGTKAQAEDYINKRGKFAEKGETVTCIATRGLLKGVQGKRSDLDTIEEMLSEGRTAKDILSVSLSYRRYEKMVKSAYYAKRDKETPFIRDVKVYWHVGESGSGKSYSAQTVLDTRGADSLYFLTDYSVGGFDNYAGEPVLFMDEFRGQMQFSVFLGLLDQYKTQVHSRYTNILTLWDEVHITSVIPPERMYKKMVLEHSDLDTYSQLRRRITEVMYHYKDSDGTYQIFAQPGSEYSDYATIKLLAQPLPATDYLTLWGYGGTLKNVP
ncbi:MAG: hypothetical protein LBN05_02905 [Oscillospiraceae bacterium]|nr:hypothetical protein [Oscillospiraceae bacterium]